MISELETIIRQGLDMLPFFQRLRKILRNNEFGEFLVQQKKRERTEVVKG